MAQPEGVQTLLSEAYTFLSKLDIESAEASMERALERDFEDGELLFSMKCCRWWSDSIAKAAGLGRSFEAGEYILGRWKAFKTFLGRLDGGYERAVLAFRHFAFGTALALYQGLASDGELTDPELALRLGRTKKGLGDYDEATRCLEAASKSRRDDAAILAELADVYGLAGEARASKALFREAFFLNPQRIDLDFLESDALLRLADRIADMGKGGMELVEWIPVYGDLLGVFSIKRELKPIEAGKLKQSIYECETELGADGSRRSVLVPRLINRYFWLVDHYINQKEAKPRIDEILLKIKLLDPSVYAQYIA